MSPARKCSVPGAEFAYSLPEKHNIKKHLCQFDSFIVMLDEKAGLKQQNKQFNGLFPNALSIVWCKIRHLSRFYH